MSAIESQKTCCRKYVAPVSVRFIEPSIVPHCPISNTVESLVRLITRRKRTMALENLVLLLRVTYEVPKLVRELYMGQQRLLAGDPKASHHIIIFNDRMNAPSGDKLFAHRPSELGSLVCKRQGTWVLQLSLSQNLLSPYIAFVALTTRSEGTIY